jgi:hypothetical protein
VPTVSNGNYEAASPVTSPVKTIDSPGDQTFAVHPRETNCISTMAGEAHRLHFESRERKMKVAVLHNRELATPIERDLKKTTQVVLDGQW